MEFFSTFVNDQMLVESFLQHNQNITCDVIFEFVYFFNAN